MPTLMVHHLLQTSMKVGLVALVVGVEVVGLIGTNVLHLSHFLENIPMLM